MTDVLRWMQPRDHAHAARVIAVLIRVAALVTAAVTLVEIGAGRGAADDAVVLVAVVALVVVAQTAHRWGPGRRWAWAAVPLGSVALLITLNLITDDVSVTAQVFLFFPALYGASELPRRGAVTLLAACLLGDAVMVVVMLPWWVAVTQFVYLAAAMGTTTFLLTRAREIQEALVAQLTRMAAVDPLTGLVTRRVLDEAAQSALSGSASRVGTALILLDIDNFKGINDRFGHVAGDDVLVQLSALLTRTAGPDEVVSRLGGDEIAVLLPGCTEERMAERGLAVLALVRATPFDLPDGRSIPVTLSAGMAHAPTHGDGLRQLYAAADTGLYASKRAGRDQIRTPDQPTFDPSRPERADRR